MEKLLFLLEPESWPKRLTYILVILTCAVTASLAVAQTVMYRSRLKEPRAVEGTFNGIKTNETCRVIKTDYSVNGKKAETSAEVVCSKTGKHELRGIGVPPPYFKKINDGVVSIRPEEYETRRLW